MSDLMDTAIMRLCRNKWLAAHDPQRWGLLIPVERAITGYHLDDEGDWVAELSCGHNQHVRHRPPFRLRAWVTEGTEQTARPAPYWHSWSVHIGRAASREIIAFCLMRWTEWPYEGPITEPLGIVFRTYVRLVCSRWRWLTRPQILHADLDAFYASVEQLLNPRLRQRPIAVGGGVVLAASYEAKALGVRAGMVGWRAHQLCPSLLFVGGHFGEYQRLGDQVIEVLRDFTPLVERISIDEAFLDVGGTVHLFGSPSDIAAAIRRRVRNEIGLGISVGVARTKHLAKVASQAAKPDGLVVVEPNDETTFLDPLPVEMLWGVGPATRTLLDGVGIRTIGDLAATPSPLLEHLLGDSVGRKLTSLASNTDPRRIETARRQESVGAQAALGRQMVTLQLIRSTIGYLADRVGSRLRAANQAGLRSM